MALKVIGSGLGRTGTLSLKLALEALGFGPCHHMVEVFMRPETVPLWVDAGEGRADWEAIFDGYASMVDYPGANYWRELAAFYPQAKVIHSVRDPDAWFESCQATIFAPDSPASKPPPAFQRFFALMKRDFAERVNDRAFMVDYFRRWNAAVVAALPPERLLVWEPGQGWGPLCDFLGVAVPDRSFPRANSREEFQARSAGRVGAPPTPEELRKVLSRPEA
jgi:hypothetical protein